MLHQCLPIGYDSAIFHNNIIMASCFYYAAERNASANSNMAGTKDTFIFQHKTAKMALWIESYPVFCNIIDIGVIF